MAELQRHTHQPGHSCFIVMTLCSKERAILLVFSNLLFYMCTKMSNRPVQEENVDKSDGYSVMERYQADSILVVLITPSIQGDKSILKGELAWTIMKIRVIRTMFDLKGSLMGWTKTLVLHRKTLRITQWI